MNLAVEEQIVRRKGKNNIFNILVGYFADFFFIIDTFFDFQY
jgi:hypothetical protein